MPRASPRGPADAGQSTNSLTRVVHHFPLSTYGVLAGAHTRYPNDVLSTDYYGPTNAKGTNNPGVCEKALDPPPPAAQVSCEAISRMPLPDNRFDCFWNVDSPVAQDIRAAAVNTSGWLRQKAETAEPGLPGWA